MQKQATNDEDEEKIFVRFFTKLNTSYSITDSPISLPVKLRRLGLSQVVNHLLGLEKPVPFDFLINNVFLRTTLKKFIQKNNLEAENTINIEYVLALGEPDTSDSLQHDDWVSALDNHQHIHNHELIMTGSYDTLIRFWKNRSNSKKPQFALQGHTGHINALTSARKEDNTILVVSASQDQSLRIWNVNPSTITAACSSILIGHTDSVTSCDLNSAGCICSGSWDMNIKIWDLQSPEYLDDNETAAVATSTAKKKKSFQNIYDETPSYSQWT
jgi:ribosome biogenesis protein YTM1